MAVVLKASFVAIPTACKRIRQLVPGICVITPGNRFQQDLVAKRERSYYVHELFFYTSEAYVIGWGTPLSLASRPYHIPRTILIGA